jgi:hypothetical protein
MEELAGRLGVEIRYGNIPGEDSHRAGGLCKVNGKYMLIIHCRITKKEKIGVMMKYLKGFEIDDVYLIPAIRELLDKPVQRQEEES